MSKIVTEPTPEELEKEAGTIMETPTFDIIQPELFAEFIHREEDFSLKFAENTPFEVWEAYTRGIFEMGRRSMRDAGECLLFGERKYGEKYAQVIDAMRYAPKTLQNASWVVSRIERWHDSLSFGHHEVVAALPPKAQEEMLTVAEKEALTVSKLKKATTAKYPSKRPSKKGGDKKTPPKIDLTSEVEVLQAGHMVIAFLEAEEAKLAFRKWPAARLAKWNPILSTLVKISRRSIIKTH
jgi:hypothetical protein